MEVDHVDGSMSQMDTFYTQNLRSALEKEKQEVKLLRNRMKEMEAKYRQTRFALEEKEEELRSFKDRVAGDVALSIKTGKTESMNNPVSKNRLKEMYEEFRQQWPKIKNHLRKKEDSKFVQALIQRKFEDATHDMEKKKEYVDKVFRLKEPSSGSTSQKVREYKQSVILHLQLALYYSRKDGACSKTFLSTDEGVKPQDVLGYLSSDCYWLGCLLALNNPPLQPDWENHETGMDPWNMLPRNLRAASVMQRKQNQQ